MSIHQQAHFDHLDQLEFVLVLIVFVVIVCCPFASPKRSAECRMASVRGWLSVVLPRCMTSSSVSSSSIDGVVHLVPKYWSVWLLFAIVVYLYIIRPLSEDSESDPPTPYESRLLLSSIRLPVW